MVDLPAATLADLMVELDRAYPGIRFRMIDEQDRIRPHIRLFVNSQQTRGLDMPVTGRDEIHIICALSGG